jgi:hypothetical protein
MENLGWLMYLCSIADGVESVATLFLVISIVGFIATAITYANLDCELATAKRWWKKFLIIGIPSLFLTVLIPSKETSYQILGITVATKIIKDSKALQELPEKSFEALNRFLDSIVPEEKQEE